MRQSPLIASLEMGISTFSHVSADRTIKIACNSPFNTIKRKDVHLLIKHYMVQDLTKKERLNNSKKLQKSFYIIISCLLPRKLIYYLIGMINWI